MLLPLATNKIIFAPQNLLLEQNYPLSDPPEYIYYVDINSGTWFKEAIEKEYIQPKHILIPFCHFIDGLVVDTY